MLPGTAPAMLMGGRRRSVLTSRRGRRTPTEMEAEGRSRTLRRRRQLPGRRVPATPRGVASARRASRTQDRLVSREHYHPRRDQPVIEAPQGAADHGSDRGDESAGIGGGSAAASSRMSASRSVGRHRARPETARRGFGPRFRPGGRSIPTGARAGEHLIDWSRSRGTGDRAYGSSGDQVSRSRSGSARAPPLDADPGSLTPRSAPGSRVRRPAARRRSSSRPAPRRRRPRPGRASAHERDRAVGRARRRRPPAQRA